tara:strand:- start:330 stop:734 length:405 start_codon:yes stop_codon:yes gene_type:complete
MSNSNDQLFLATVEMLDGFLQLLYCARQVLPPSWTAARATTWINEPIGWLLGELTEALEQHDEAMREIIGCTEQFIAFSGNKGAPSNRSSTTNSGGIDTTPEPLEQLLQTKQNVQRLMNDNNTKEKNQWLRRVK